MGGSSINGNAGKQGYSGHRHPSSKPSPERIAKLMKKKALKKKK